MLQPVPNRIGHEGIYNHSWMNKVINKEMKKMVSLKNIDFSNNKKLFFQEKGDDNVVTKDDFKDLDKHMIPLKEYYKLYKPSLSGW